jgi:hypothetical protein
MPRGPTPIYFSDSIPVSNQRAFWGESDLALVSIALNENMVALLAGNNRSVSHQKERRRIV